MSFWYFLVEKLFKNIANYRIDAFYATPGSNRNWGSNLLTNVIYPGNNFYFSANSIECVWDAKIVFQNGTSIYGYNLDMCTEPFFYVTNSSIY